MSIADKFPPAPEGGVWEVRMSEYGGMPSAWVSLRPSPGFLGINVIIHSPGGLVSELDEDSLIRAAESILEGYHRSVEEGKKRSARMDAYKKAYAHLLTED